MAAVSRGAWFSIAYITLLTSLAIVTIWAVVQLRTEMNYLSWLVLSVFYPPSCVSPEVTRHWCSR